MRWGGGWGRGSIDQPWARTKGFAAGSPTPKVFSYGIRFIMGPWRFRALVSGDWRLESNKQCGIMA